MWRKSKRHNLTNLPQWKISLHACSFRTHAHTLFQILSFVFVVWNIVYPSPPSLPPSLTPSLPLYGDGEAVTTGYQSKIPRRHQPPPTVSMVVFVRDFGRGSAGNSNRDCENRLIVLLAEVERREAGSGELKMHKLKLERCLLLWESAWQLRVSLNYSFTTAFTTAGWQGPRTMGVDAKGEGRAGGGHKFGRLWILQPGWWVMYSRESGYCVRRLLDKRTH